MKNRIFLFLLLLSGFAQAQTMINGVAFPNTYTVGKDKIQLNGGGTRNKYWIDLYVGGLYLINKNNDPNKIIAENASQGIRIYIVSSHITSDRMIEAIDEGFQRSTGGKQASFKTQIDKFKKAFSDPIAVKDIFEILYNGEKISIYKNKILKAEIDGFDFKKAVFGIWLGTEPADSALKNGMLGIKG